MKYEYRYRFFGNGFLYSGPIEAATPQDGFKQVLKNLHLEPDDEMSDVFYWELPMPIAFEPNWVNEIVSAHIQEIKTKNEKYMEEFELNELKILIQKYPNHARGLLNE